MQKLRRIVYGYMIMKAEWCEHGEIGLYPVVLGTRVLTIRGMPDSAFERLDYLKTGC